MTNTVSTHLDGVTDAQIRAAYHLARGRGHLWATLSGLTEDECVALQHGPVEELTERLDAESSMGGIHGPTVKRSCGAQPAIVHGGPGHRINWRIRQDGQSPGRVTITLEVTRPIYDTRGLRLGSGVAMVATLTWEPSGPCRSQVVGHEHQILLSVECGPLAIEHRHVDALADDLRALGVEWGDLMEAIQAAGIDLPAPGEHAAEPSTRPSVGTGGGDITIVSL